MGYLSRFVAQSRGFPMAALLLSATPLPAQAQAGAGIPVTDRLVVARCGTCHTADERGNLQRISWARATPEGWQAAVQRMVREHDLANQAMERAASHEGETMVGKVVPEGLKKTINPRKT